MGSNLHIFRSTRLYIYVGFGLEDLLWWCWVSGCWSVHIGTIYPSKIFTLPQASVEARQDILVRVHSWRLDLNPVLARTRKVRRDISLWIKWQNATLQTLNRTPWKKSRLYGRDELVCLDQPSLWPLWSLHSLKPSIFAGFLRREGAQNRVNTVVFYPFEASKSTKKHFRHNLYWFLSIVRPFLKPRHLKNNRFLRIVFPDSHIKPCTAIPQFHPFFAPNRCQPPEDHCDHDMYINCCKTKLCLRGALGGMNIDEQVRSNSALRLSTCLTF